MDVFSVSRELLKSDLWTSEPFTRGQAWVDLIGHARWKSGFARVKGVKIELLRGQLCWSEVKLAERWKWSRGKVRRFLKELEMEQQIVQVKSSVTSVISLVNYERYQLGGTADGTGNGHATVQQTDMQRTCNGTRKKKVKKDKHETKGSAGCPNTLKETSGFDFFWSKAHRKVGKRGAEKAFPPAVANVSRQRNITGPEAELWLAERMEEFAKSAQAKDPIRGKIHPATWLNDGRYDDDESLWNEQKDDNPSVYKTLGEKAEGIA